MVYAFLLFPFSKCSLFHNSNVYGCCIIHILYTGCVKIKKKTFRRQKVKYFDKCLFCITFPSSLLVSDVIGYVHRHGSAESTAPILRVRWTDIALRGWTIYQQKFTAFWAICSRGQVLSYLQRWTPLKTGLNQNYISVRTSQRTQFASTTKSNIVEGRRSGIVSGAALPSAGCTATPCHRDMKQTRKDSEVRFVSEHIKDLTEDFATNLD